MGTLFITSFFLLGIIILAIYLRQQASSTDGLEKQALPPAERFGGLFGDRTLRDAPEGAAGESDAESTERRARLLSRAAEGHLETLTEAQASPAPGLYEEVLDALVERASGSDKKLLALVSYVTRQGGLRVNRKLAEAVLESWRAAPTRPATAKMLHIVALADDAALLQAAVELALESVRDGRIENLAVEELYALASGEYWLLTSASRSSGAGFMLKRTLASLRREVESAASRHR